MNNLKNKKERKKQRGAIMVLIIVFTTIFFTIISGVLSLIIYQKKLFKIRYAQESALQVAEAGLEYYRWHLAHDATDYTDGTGDACSFISPCGPYEHVYKNNTGTPIGTFSLTITPPETVSSSMVTIQSTGWLTTNPNQTRTLEIDYEKKPLTRYAILSNSYLSIPTLSVTNGPVHSNKGIRFDGIANNVVTSSVTQDNGDTAHATAMEYGVHTHKIPTDPLPPTATPSRPDVFVAGRSFPVPEVDFNALSTVLDDLLVIAQNDDSCGISNSCVITNSSKKGWHLQLLGNGTFQYRKVKKDGECEPPGPTEEEYDTGEITNYSGNWIIKTLPTNGVIFVQDNVWIDGSITSNRVTIVAAEDPLANQVDGANIWINDNLTYATMTGAEAIGLIAQNNVSVGLYSADNLTIDAAMIAKNGRIGREQFVSVCGAEYTRAKITINGSLITNQGYGFSYTGLEGYQIQEINYDSNLYNSPPPHFPAETEFNIISWQEK